MKYLAEFRDGGMARRLIEEIHRLTTRPWAIMEVCGGQTHAILRHGLDQVLPSRIELVHGPGCPVCVTPLEVIDRALAIAARPEVTFCSFGDMLRVPGSSQDLFGVRSDGGDVRVVYSPLDALNLARTMPDREVVFFAIGFETTAPANAMAVRLARQQRVSNFSLLVSQVLVPPAMEAILQAPAISQTPAISHARGRRVQAFLAAGHVASVMGYWQYPPLASRYGTPIVVTGFELLDLLDGIRRAVRQLESGQALVENAFGRAVTQEGNVAAQRLINEVFEVGDRSWRGIGMIPASGWRLRDEFADLDAEQRFPVGSINVQESPLCRSGDVLQGLIRPSECPAFGKQCTPRTPLGATMVSAEGACGAYFQYGRQAASGASS